MIRRRQLDTEHVEDALFGVCGRNDLGETRSASPANRFFVRKQRSKNPAVYSMQQHLDEAVDDLKGTARRAAGTKVAPPRRS